MMKGFAAILLIVAVLCGCATAQAQSAAPGSGGRVFELGVGFLAVHANAGPAQCGCFFMEGGNAQIMMVNPRGIALVGDYGRTSIKNINGWDYNITLSTYLGGLRYNPHFDSRWAPFGQALVGAGHTSSNYPIEAGVTRLAGSAGAGLNYKLSRRWQIKLVEADYLVTRIPNGVNDVQNQLRLSAGLTYRFVKHRKDE